MPRLVSLMLSCALASVAPGQTVFHRVADLVASAGLSPVQVYGTPSDDPLDLDARFTQGHLIDVEVAAWQIPDRALKDRLSFLIRNDSMRLPGSPLTGQSLGEDAHYLAGTANTCNVRAFADRFSIDVSVSWSKIGSDADVVTRAQFSRALCQRLARRILGGAMALDLNDDGSLRQTGTLTGMETDKTGFVPLADWASAHGVTMTYDDTTEIASFTYRGRKVQLPLASDKVIVGGQALDLGGKFILARGARWFVPRSELDAALG